MDFNAETRADTENTMQDNDGMRIRTEPDGSGRIVHVAGELSLVNASALKTVLMDRLAPRAKTVLDAAGIASIDLCGLQLLCSARKTWAAHSAVLEFGGISEALRESARVAGYGACQSACAGDSSCPRNW